MRQVTIRFEGRTGSGKTVLRQFFQGVLQAKGFRIVNWGEDDNVDWLVVEHDLQTLVEGTMEERFAA